MIEWLVRSVLRLWATALVAAGAALGLAAVASSASGGVSAEIAGYMTAAAIVAGVWLVCGGAALYLTIAKAPLLPNERARPDNVSRPVWIAASAVVLFLLPVVIAVQLRPTIAFWRDLVDAFDRAGVWDAMQQSPGSSGIALAPFIAAAIVPVLQAMTAVSLVFAAGLGLLMLLASRAWLPRLLLIGTLILGALTFATGTGTLVAARARTTLETLVRESPDASGVRERTLEQMARYGEAARSATAVLTEAWVTWALLTIVVLASRDAAPAFARPPDRVERIDHQSASDAERARYFERLSKRLDS